MKEIVLASASPRRLELLKQIGLEFSVFPSDIDERIDIDSTPEEAVQSLSFRKAVDVAGKLQNSPLVIGADTIVFKDSILGKPENEDHAFRMLKMLQGGWHEVITGITVIDSSNGNHLSGYEKTRVKMRKLSDGMISSYIHTGEPLDKAGAYGIQGMGALLVEKIEGCYFNVVGLPLLKLSLMLEKFGVNIL